MIDEIIIAGPTASGKTALSVELAKIMGGEIISVDSRQCYKRLNIGTAKPDASQLAQAVHHNISVLELEDHDSAAKFYARATQYREDIKARGKTVIYCGGSTLHLQSLIQSLDDIPPADKSNLDYLEKMEKEEGLMKLFQMLEEKDPDYASKMDGLNRQRILRALDIWMQTGKPFSSFHHQNEPVLPENMAAFVLKRPRKELYERISLRTEKMFEMGFLDEVEEILADGYSPGLQSLQTVGYREAVAYLNGDMRREQMVEKMKTSTRRYAKRQITWMRRWSFAVNLDVSETSSDENIHKILTFQKDRNSDGKKG